MVTMDDLWTPQQGLPDGTVLGRMTRRMGEIWSVPHLESKVRIAYNGRLRSSLGRAILNTNRVELNVRLLRQNPAELVPTLIHELAHVAVHWRFGRVEPHGRHFRSFMGQAGLPGRATHRLDVTSVRRQRARYFYVHTCSGCRCRFVARRVRRDCYCRACGPGLQWNILRVPATPEGLETIKKLIPV